MESAAALIGSQPCDVFIACLGCHQGQVTIGLSGGGCTRGGGWFSCGNFLFFLSVGGWGEEEGGGADHTLVPATPEPTPRARRYVEHVHRHEYNGPGPRDRCARFGVMGWQKRAGTESDFLRFAHGGTDPVRGPRRLLPYAAGSGRPVLAFFAPSFA